MAAWSTPDGPIETALELEFVNQHPQAGRGALFRRQADYWKITVVGPDQEAWKAVPEKLLARPKMTEGWLLL